MNKIILTLFTVVFCLCTPQYTKGADRVIYYEFNDSITSVLKNYLDKHPDEIGYCRMSFESINKADSIIEIDFFSVYKDHNYIINSKRFLLVGNYRIPVTFEWDSYFNQDVEWYRKNNGATRRVVVIINDGVYFSINQKTGEIKRNNQIYETDE